eukprot:4151370-Pleurochrysis_carterae.AAC.3
MDAAVLGNMRVALLSVSVDRLNPYLAQHRHLLREHYSLQLSLFNLREYRHRLGKRSALIAALALTAIVGGGFYAKYLRLTLPS